MQSRDKKNKTATIGEIECSKVGDLFPVYTVKISVPREPAYIIDAFSLPPTYYWFGQRGKDQKKGVSTALVGVPSSSLLDFVKSFTFIKAFLIQKGFQVTDDIAISALDTLFKETIANPLIGEDIPAKYTKYWDKAKRRLSDIEYLRNLVPTHIKVDHSNTADYAIFGGLFLVLSGVGATFLFIPLLVQAVTIGASVGLGMASLGMASGLMLTGYGLGYAGCSDKQRFFSNPTSLSERKCLGRLRDQPSLPPPSSGNEKNLNLEEQKDDSSSSAPTPKDSDLAGNYF